MKRISIPKISFSSGNVVTFCPEQKIQSHPEPPTPPSYGGETILTLPYIEATYDVISVSTVTKVLYSSHFISYGTDRMFFDGELHPSATAYRFGTLGQHVVKIVSSVVGNTAFYGCSQLTKVVVPYGITRLGEQSFADCKRLRDITLPDTIETIGTGVFDSFSDGVIRINGKLTETLRSLITEHFMGCKLYVDGKLTSGIL